MNAILIAKGKKAALNGEVDKKAENEASELIQKMSDATHEDRESYKAKKPALKKLLLAS